MSPPAFESVPTTLGVVTPLRLLGKGKSGYSYLAMLGNERVVLKLMHDEPCAYYSFGDNKVKLEVQAYDRLTEVGLTLPKLLTFDMERNFLVKDYVDGFVADRWDASDADLDEVMSQLFDMARLLQNQGINIDYFPANFVIKHGRAQYIDYELNPYMKQWGFDAWGIYYWANLKGLRQYTESRDWRHINESEHSGLPIKAPFEAKVAQWRSRYER
jgi:TP53 regulating kinase and related kinases